MVELKLDFVYDQERLFLYVLIEPAGAKFMKISVEFPENTKIETFEQEYLKKALVATLYNIGKISEKEACIILSLRRRAFEDLLPQFGFSVLSSVLSDE